jgi:hypothetical protein
MTTLTQKEAHRLFEYRDGELFWKNMTTTRTGNLVGKVAGSMHKQGYKIISVTSTQQCVQGQIDSMITPPVSPSNTPLPWAAA